MSEHLETKRFHTEDDYRRMNELRIEAYHQVAQLEDELEVTQRQLEESRRCCMNESRRIQGYQLQHARMKKQLDEAIRRLAMPRSKRERLTLDQWVTLLGQIPLD